MTILTEKNFVWEQLTRNIVINYKTSLESNFTLRIFRWSHCHCASTARHSTWHNHGNPSAVYPNTILVSVHLMVVVRGDHRVKIIQWGQIVIGLMMGVWLSQVMLVLVKCLDGLPIESVHCLWRMSGRYSHTGIFGRNSWYHGVRVGRTWCSPCYRLGRNATWLRLNVCKETYRVLSFTRFSKCFQWMV